MPVNPSNPPNQITNPAAAIPVYFDASQPVPVEVIGTVPVSFSTANPIPITATSLPLPTGAATETGNLATLVARTPMLVSGRQPVDGSGVTQPVSGTFWQATQPVSLSSLPALSTGANTIGAVNVNGTVPVSGTFYQATQPVSAAALPLPTGAATETGNLATLVARTPVAGQALSAASSPVVLASDQSVISVNQAGVSATGSLAGLNATVALSLNGATGWAADVRGTFVGTINFQASVDGTNWVTIPALVYGSAVNVATVTSVAAVGTWLGSAPGAVQIRALMSAFTSGSATVVLRAMSATSMVYNMPTGATGLTVSTVSAITAGANLIGDVGNQYRANATGAATVLKILSAATTNPTVVKATAGRLLGWQIGNTTAAWRYVKLYNVAAAPTAGAGTIVAIIAIPPGGQSSMDIVAGTAYSVGIAFTTVTGSADTDATAVGVGDLVGQLYFA